MTKRIFPKHLKKDWDTPLEWEFRILIFLVIWEICLPFIFYDIGLEYGYFLQLPIVICFTIFHYKYFFKRMPVKVNEMFEEIRVINRRKREKVEIEENTIINTNKRILGGRGNTPKSGNIRKVHPNTDVNKRESNYCPNQSSINLVEGENTMDIHHRERERLGRWGRLKEQMTRGKEKWDESPPLQFSFGELLFLFSYVDLFQDISFLLIAYNSHNIPITVIAMFSTLFSLAPKVFFYIWIYFSKTSPFTDNHAYILEKHRFIYIYELGGLAPFYEMAYPTINGPVVDFPLLVCIYKFVTEDLIQSIIQLTFISIYKDDEHIYAPIEFLVCSEICSVFFSIFAIWLSYQKVTQAKKDRKLCEQSIINGKLCLNYVKDQAKRYPLYPNLKNFQNYMLFAQSATINALDLSGNPLENAGTSLASIAYGKNSQIREINLSSVEMKNHGVLDLIEAIKKRKEEEIRKYEANNYKPRPSLNVRREKRHHIDISHNDISVGVIIALIQACVGIPLGPLQNKIFLRISTEGDKNKALVESAKDQFFLKNAMEIQFA